MGLLVVNSDFERLWNEPYPTISFDNTSYSLAGEVGTELSATFAIFDNYDADVTEQCEITFDNDYVSIEEGMFVCEDLEVGTYQTIATATYSYKSATVTETATINIAVQEQQPTSISFNSSTYSMSGNEDEALTQAFSVSDDLNNDITTLCSYSFSPNDKGLYADGGYFKVDSAIAGTYSITVTATYGELTNTATISMSVVDLPNSISFDSATYTITGTEYDTIQQQFAVTDDLNNDVTMDCSYSFSPNDTDLVVSDVGGEYYAFDASSVSAGTYSVTVTATYAARNLTTTATISMDIASAGHDYSKDYLTFEALANGTFSLFSPASVDSTKMTSVSYSLDNGETWVDTAITNTDQTITTPTVTSGNKVLWKGVGTALNKSGQNTPIFRSTANCNVSGNIMSLLYGDNFIGQTVLTAKYAFYGLFKTFYSNGAKVVSAENLVLPATTLTNFCYNMMFTECTTLTTAPKKLPATTLANSCYSSMFQGCHNLTTAPTLPATTLAVSCYNNMFDTCRFLITAPELPATTLAASCYSAMFKGSYRMTTAPELPATTLAQSCYANMFNGCTAVDNIKMLATDISASGCLTDWVNNVAASGTFTKAASMTTLPSGASGIPENWTVVDA